MLENQVLLDSILAITGRDLIFPTYTQLPILPSIVGTTIPTRYIKAYTGFSTVNIINHERLVVGAEYQSFNFYTSSKICRDNSIEEGDKFYITDGIYAYNFEVANTPIMQTDGWARFPADYINRIEI